jgi:hypothetical protein
MVDLRQPTVNADGMAPNRRGFLVITANAHHAPIVSIRSQVASKHKHSEYTARLALDADTKRDAYQLRYDSYLDSGFINPNPSKMFSDKFDELANAVTIVVYAEGSAIASVRACFLSRSSDITSPAKETFPDEMHRILQNTAPSRHNLEGVEVTRLVRSPAAANNQGLVFLLYRLTGHLALLNDFKVVISCVRQNHVPFYKRLRFQEASAPKPYPGLSCPMQMLACSRDDYDAVRSGFPIMDSEASPAGSFDGFLTGGTITVPLLQRG